LNTQGSGEGEKPEDYLRVLDIRQDAGGQKKEDHPGGKTNVFGCSVQPQKLTRRSRGHKGRALERTRSEKKTINFHRGISNQVKIRGGEKSKKEKKGR